ncbi:hypothetical protein F7234_03905 [Pseudomonas putida]|uniref:hypothetical protein n=1 Tax=Pseudomonas putida TaxID=303 RepID=UPI00125F70F9|nr:hypothetical protein [Pseudomonas putida]KAB5626288.1 hypothetical protein F7234_03905 [Pseudomonas putida]
MDQLNHIALDVEVLKAVVIGLVRVIQEDPVMLEKVRDAALGTVRGFGSVEAHDLVHKHVTAMLAPKLYSAPTPI